MKKVFLAVLAAVVAIGIAVPVALSANNITDGLAVAPLYHYGPNPAGVPALSPRTLPSGLVTVTYNDGQDRFNNGHSRFTAGLLVTNALPNTKYVLDIRYWAFGPQSELGTLTTNKWGGGTALFSVSDVTPTPGFYIDISVKNGGGGAGNYGDTFIAGPFTLPKAKAAPITAVSEPTFKYNVNSCSVTVPYTPGLDTRLYGVNGYSEDAPITHDVTITAGLAGVAGTAGQFWVGYKAQPGYVDSNPGAGTSHIDFYNGDSVADCGATGEVTWDYQGVVTGTVSFNADATGGSLDYTNSNGQTLHGVVTSYRQIDAHTAVFAGTITGGSADYTINHPGADYFFAKVVDGTSGSPDQIAVLANSVPDRNGVAYDMSMGAAFDYDMSLGAGIVTGGNLVVN